MTCHRCIVDLPIKKVDNVSSSLSRLFNKGVEFFNLSFEDIYRPSKKSKFCEPRHMIMFVIYNNTSYTYEEISYFFNRKQHTYSRHGVVTARNHYQTEESYRVKCDALKLFLFN